MPFEIGIEDAAVLKQLDELTKNIKALEQEVPIEFFNWQAEDMHRSYPKVEDSGDTVSTMIYPRGRRTSHLKARLKSLVGGGRPARRKATVRRAAVGGARRPILRPVLYEMLKKRMMEMLQEAAKWR